MHAIDEPDPGADLDRELADLCAAVQHIDHTRQHIHDRLVAVAAWDIARQDAAGEAAIAQLREYLATVDHATLVEVVIQAMWSAAAEQAKQAHEEIRQEIAGLDAPAPAKPADPTVCEDPEGHREQDLAATPSEVSWWRRSRGLCGWCGRPIRGGKYRA